MTLEQRILALLTHRDNLANAKTFEEYQSAHVALTELLIEDLESDQKNTVAMYKFMAWSWPTAPKTNPPEHLQVGEETP